MFTFYQEPVFLITSLKNINNLQQMQNQRIDIGTRQSGLAASAKLLLKSAQILETVNTHYRDTSISVKLLENNKIQSVFLNYINPKIRKKIENKELFVVPISEQLIDELHKTFPYFSVYHYKIDKYMEVETLAVTSILVVNKNVDDILVNQIIRILDKSYYQLEFPKGYKKSNQHFCANPLKKWHPGVAKFLKKNHIQTNDIDQFNIHLLYVILAISLISLLSVVFFLFILYHADIFHRFGGSHTIINILHNIYRYIFKHKYIVLLISIFLGYVIFVLLIKYFEHNWAIFNNEPNPFDNFSFLQCLSWLFVFGNSGYNGDIFPSSEEGRLIISLVPLLGMGGTLLFIGLLTFDQIKKYIWEANGMNTKRLKNHIVLCGWSDNAHFIIKNLLHKNIKNKRQIVILADSKYQEEISTFQFDPMYISYIKGVATSREDLSRSNIAEAEIAIVTSNSQTPDPDARAILKVLTIEKFCIELENEGKRTSRESIHTIAEIADPQNISIAEDAGANQIISLGNIGSKIFTQAIQNPGVSKFLNEILTYNDQNDIYSLTISKNSTLLGKTYDEILHNLREYNILLLSINIENRKRKKDVANIVKQYGLLNPVITNPFREEEKMYTTHEGDLIIVLAQYEENVIKAMESLEL